MESNRKLEMDGICTSDVYDIFHPTPVPLKELAAIAVSLKIWRCKANEYRDNRKLEEFCPSGERIVLKKTLPDLPTVIYTAIDKYVRRLGPSMENWLKEHHNRIYYDHQNFILDYFDNFLCDYTGTIDYVRTARRMMHCDRFDENQKFIIACTYFFEDDIRRLWPLVSKNMDLNCIDFSKSPQLYYWICCLRNELDKIPFTEIKGSIETVMLDVFMPNNRPSVEYFWNHIPVRNRMRKAVDFYYRDALSFARFILPNLDDKQLEEFLNVGSYELISILFKNVWYDKELILPTWMYIKKAINVDGFTKLVVKMLQDELMVRPRSLIASEGNDPFLKYRIWLDLYCEIWISAPENLKRSAVVKVTSNKWLFCNLIVRVYYSPAVPKEFEFLSTFLSDATSTERRRFWFDYLEEFMKSARWKELEKVIKLCFKNEDEIAEFKENVMANRDSVCRTLLHEASVDDLNDFSNFLWSDIQAARSFKQRMLRLAFFGSPNEFTHATICKTKELNKFIEDAFDDVELSMNFKNQLTSSPEIQRELSQYALSVPFEQLVEFIDTFVSSEKTLLEIKALFIDKLKEKAVFCKSSMYEFPFTPLLSWCLSSQEEIAKFKDNYLRYEIHYSVILKSTFGGLVMPAYKALPRR